jgi:hypothetical protein
MRQMHPERVVLAAPERVSQRGQASVYTGRERAPPRRTDALPTTLLGVLRERLRLRRYSSRTSDVYVAWVR